MRLGVAAAVVDGALVRGDVEIDGRIRQPASAFPTDGRGLAIPGLVDLQVNGYAGVDVLACGARRARRDGSCARPRRRALVPADARHEPARGHVAALQSIGQAHELGEPARILGAHLEGPFLSPVRPGAHAVELLRKPDLDVLAALLLAGCPVTMVTLAPELDDAVELIEALARRGVVVSLGHTDATATVAHGAFDHGAPGGDASLQRDATVRPP